MNILLTIIGFIALLSPIIALIAFIILRWDNATTSLDKYIKKK